MRPKRKSYTTKELRVPKQGIRATKQKLPKQESLPKQPSSTNKSNLSQQPNQTLRPKQPKPLSSSKESMESNIKSASKAKCETKTKRNLESKSKVLTQTASCSEINIILTEVSEIVKSETCIQTRETKSNQIRTNKHKVQHELKYGAATKANQTQKNLTRTN